MQGSPYRERGGSGEKLMELFKQFDPTELIKRALAEDVGQGDITTAATVASGAKGRARISVKESRMILAGGILIEPVMKQAGAEPRIISVAHEGAELKVGDVLAEIEGKLAGLFCDDDTGVCRCGCGDSREDYRYA
jgi:nicotinate-nucleotide pyrophosphorylase